ncbi:homoserine kinase [Nocardioides euryhalodurans]|uniref:Homoserine kinase n=1 Tax=Nocardioides euryhalodurans TaxID=2518370 RepID=A0A4P7GIH6_9ACTN|nr:homoserine kinase [Nocardioides euryhalodurans]QBR91735.1 homoserine kinase [Nocardioides euryhalodurans]
MTTFVQGPVQVSVPATSANLGPGYDALGLALDLRDTLTGEVTGGGLTVEVTGEGSDEVPRDETHLVVRAMNLAFDEMGQRPPGLRLRCDNAVPHARGLGSSSAAIVGGIALARALVAGGTLLLDDDAAFRLAARLEGHPDNVAPAWYGGFVVSGHEGEDFWAVPASVDPRVSAVVFVPPTPVSTEAARQLLPDTVPHADAAANAGRAALLVTALAGRPEHLHLATRDWLHQTYRRPAMPESLDLVDALRAGGVAAVVSGAGPTVLAFCAGCDAAELRRGAPHGWRSLSLEVSRDGVRVA